LALLAKKANGTHAMTATVLCLLAIAWVTFGQNWTGFPFRLHLNLAIVIGTVALVSVGAALSSFKKGEME
jgi:hypothetical protein